MERRLTFIDVDENRLELWLKPDRIQLVVIDSRPELEAAELRRFASVIFAEYVAPDLGGRLAAARGRLQDARDRARDVDRLPGAAAGGDLAAALDGALRAIDGVAAAVALAGPAGHRPAPPPPLQPVPPALPRASRKRARRGRRAEEGSTIRWGGTTIALR